MIGGGICIPPSTVAWDGSRKGDIMNEGRACRRPGHITALRGTWGRGIPLHPGPTLVVGPSVHPCAFYILLIFC